MGVPDPCLMRGEATRPAARGSLLVVIVFGLNKFDVEDENPVLAKDGVGASGVPSSGVDEAGGLAKGVGFRGVPAMGVPVSGLGATTLAGSEDAMVIVDNDGTRTNCEAQLLPLEAVASGTL